MNASVSTYLDLVRLSAALIVLIVHASGGGITGGFLWPLGRYGQTAVMVFFVLSGYVIAYVAQSREHNVSDYMAARLARLLSVVVPAVLITLVCNEIAGYVISDAYRGPWNVNEPYEYLRYVVTLFMLQDIWGLELTPTNNGPFWSISFEFIYYIMFAILFFLRRCVRVIGLLLAVAVGGPTIVLMFPIWLLGWAAYRLHERSVTAIPAVVALIPFLATLVLLTYSPAYREAFNFKILGITRVSIAGDYIDALLFFIHLLVAPSVLRPVAFLLGRVARPIAALSGLTFSLYLFHQPLVRIAAGVSPFIERPGSAANVAFVYLATFLVIALVGIPAERSKRPLQRWLVRRMKGGRRARLTSPDVVDMAHK